MHNLVEPLYRKAFQIIKNNLILFQELSEADYSTLQKIGTFISLNGNTREKKEYYYILICAHTYYQPEQDQNAKNDDSIILINFNKYYQLAIDFEQANYLIFNPENHIERNHEKLISYAIIPAACIVADIIEYTIDNNTKLSKFSYIFIQTINNLIASNGTDEEKRQYYNMLFGAEKSFSASASINNQLYKQLKINFLTLWQIETDMISAAPQMTR